ncbi:hypothetical protein NYE69_20225 [Paenibacillus sp. FSL R5-0527]|uniref:hypothetical protein n=1 Tax=Paenibacillus sp. FSL R5-0527 TaxID=2975321 RepID=UPI000979EB0A|nr:hypothetical protein BK140_00510 [Paenibacillus macerans]
MRLGKIAAKFPFISRELPDIAGITTVFALIFTPETFKAFFRISDLCVAIPRNETRFIRCGRDAQKLFFAYNETDFMKWVSLKFSKNWRGVIQA